MAKSTRRTVAIAVSIPEHLFTSPAYRALDPLCRCLLTELLAIAKRVGTDQPVNCSARMAADMCAVSKSHAARAQDELEARGFIVSVRRGDKNGRGFGRGRASSWRITCLPFRGEWETCDYNRYYDREHNRERHVGVALEIGNLLRQSVLIQCEILLCQPAYRGAVRVRHAHEHVH